MGLAKFTDSFFTSLGEWKDSRVENSSPIHRPVVSCADELSSCATERGR